MLPGKGMCKYLWGICSQAHLNEPRLESKAPAQLLNERQTVHPASTRKTVSLSKSNVLQNLQSLGAEHLAVVCTLPMLLMPEKLDHMPLCMPTSYIPILDSPPSASSLQNPPSYPSYAHTLLHACLPGVPSFSIPCHVRCQPWCS